MKEKTPHCPNCKTNSYVVLDKKSTQVSTAIGGMAGAGSGYAGAIAKTTGEAAKAMSTNPGTLAVTLAGLVLALLMGFLTGAATGSAVGEHIDSKMRITFRCNQCGKKFKG